MKIYTNPKLSKLLPNSFTKDIEDLTYSYRQKVTKENCSLAIFSAERLLHQIEKVEIGILERYEREIVSINHKCNILKYALNRLIEQCKSYSSLEEYENYISAEFCRIKILELQEDLTHIDKEFE